VNLVSQRSAPPPPGEEHEGEQPRRFSLSARVTLLAALCVAGAVALVSFGAYLTVRNTLYGQVAENLLQRATVVARKEIRPSLTGLQEIDTSWLTQSFNDISFDILDPQGNSYLRMADSLRLPKGLYSDAERAVATGSVANSQREVNGREVVAVSYPYLSETALVVSQPLDQPRAVLGRMSLVLFLISGAGVLVAALAGTVVARGGLRPVQRLTTATERVARTGDLRPIQVAGDDELARLTRSFNSMLAAVAASQNQQRRLVADAGHELRTPLTSLRTNLELMLSSERPGAPTLSEQDREEINADLRAQLDELTTLIGDLVELARDDTPEMAVEHVDLTEVVEQALERARRRSGEVRFQTALQPWTLLGDPGALERAVLNLLDNAGKFSPPGGVVWVVLRPFADGAAVLEISDAGPGIADADLPRVFDRFYRSNEARTLPGSGLGLAIVKQVVERHGGQVYAGRSPQGGAQLTMRLPGQPG
jgi:two-component system sensor histidine kinase MprB